MSKKNVIRNISVRSTGDYLDVRLFVNGQIVFKGGCNPNDPRKVSALIELLQTKGLVIGKNNSWW